MLKPFVNFEKTAETIAGAWHNLAPAAAGAQFGLGHQKFAQAILKIGPSIAHLGSSGSFYGVLDAFADDAPSGAIETIEVDRHRSGREQGAGDLLERDILSASQMLAAGETTSQDLTDAALIRLEEVSHRTNAVLAFDREAAMDEARHSDERRTAGKSLGLLDGIPLAHKGLFYRKGLGVSAGGVDVSTFAADNTASSIRRLETAGAISIARLHLTEASFVPTGLNSQLGDCLNPWDTRSITGGSSSGSAVACATSSVFGALGSDTGGSIRIPAAICGVTGLKPTYGRVSRHGVFPVSHSHDHIGPLARSASDCAILFNAIAGRCDADATTSARPVQSLGVHTLKGIRIGISKGFFHDRLGADLAKNVDDSLRVFRDAGAHISEVPDADFDLMNSLSAMIIRAEVSALHLPAMTQSPDSFSPKLYRTLLQGIGIPYAAYDHAQRVRGAMLEDFLTRIMSNVDMLHLPVMGIPTPMIEQASWDAISGQEVAKELTVMMRPFNYLGLPCLSLPCGMHRGASGAQLPQGFQLVGRPFSENRLLKAGIAYQSLTDWHYARPSL